MQIHADATLRDLAANVPGATRVFDSLRLDYCCGGARRLSDVCRDAGLPVEQVLKGIASEASQTSSRAEDAPWTGTRLSELVHHILDRFHVFQTAEMDRIDALSRKVVERHGPTHPEIRRLGSLVREMTGELRPHFHREEQVLFPYILEVERSLDRGAEPPFAPFGTVVNPIRVMTGEHEAVGETLAKIRQVTGDYAPPKEACTSWRALYQALQDFDQDLIRHIHIENNVLFPRALDAEDKMWTGEK